MWIEYIKYIYDNDNLNKLNTDLDLSLAKYMLILLKNNIVFKICDPKNMWWAYGEDNRMNPRGLLFSNIQRDGIIKEYVKDTYSSAINLRYYLQITIRNDINEELNNHILNYNEEINYINKLFEKDHNFENFKGKIPNKENRDLIYDKYLKNNVNEISYIDEWKNLQRIPNNWDGKYIIYNLIINNINNKYNIKEYEILINKVFIVLNKLYNRKEIFRLLNSIYDILLN
tara:strand:+ start:49 stop:735 length:687 start_codon:yes stop_codon:yes gene_type:complete